MRISRVDPTSSDLITSSYVIPDLVVAIQEGLTGYSTYKSDADRSSTVIYNAIDAHSKRINLSVNVATASFYVADDGNGIEPDALFEYIFECPASSKPKTVNTPHYGKRGKFLVALAALAKCIQLESRVEGNWTSHRKDVEEGKITFNGRARVTRKSRGTCLRVTNLFHRLPVRHRDLTSQVATRSRVAKRIAEFCTNLSMIWPTLTIDVTFSDTQLRPVHVPGVATCQARLMSTFGEILSRELEYTHFESSASPFVLRGYVGVIQDGGDRDEHITSPGWKQARAYYQYVYLDNMWLGDFQRYCCKHLNEAAITSELGIPIYVLKVSSKSHEYDILSQGGGRELHLRRPELLRLALHAFIDHLITKYDGHLDKNTLIESHESKSSTLDKLIMAGDYADEGLYQHTDEWKEIPDCNAIRDEAFSDFQQNGNDEGVLSCYSKMRNEKEIQSHGINRNFTRPGNEYRTDTNSQEWRGCSNRPCNSQFQYQQAPYIYSASNIPYILVDPVPWYGRSPMLVYPSCYVDGTPYYDGDEHYNSQENDVINMIKNDAVDNQLEERETQSAKLRICSNLNELFFGNRKRSTVHSGSASSSSGKINLANDERWISSRLGQTTEHQFRSIGASFSEELNVPNHVGEVDEECSGSKEKHLKETLPVSNDMILGSTAVSEYFSMERLVRQHAEKGPRFPIMSMVSKWIAKRTSMSAHVPHHASHATRSGRLHIPTLPNDLHNLPPKGLRLDKSLLHRLRVLHQVDRKFILVSLLPEGTNGNDNCDEKSTESGLLLCIDQHAADERVRLERLEAQIFGKHGDERNIQVTNIHPPIPVRLNHKELDTLARCQSLIHEWGFLFQWKEDRSTIVLTGTPRIESRVATANDFREYIHLIGQTDPSIIRRVRPPVITKFLHSRACRGAIMFGDYLTKSQCEDLIDELCKCQLPFQCAHGRPSIVPLVEFS